MHEILVRDNFIRMSHNTQMLYIHLCLNADDEGFCSNVKSIMKVLDCTIESIDLLHKERYIINFESGVVVIKHWFHHNKIPERRIKSSKHIKEREKLILINNEYELIEEEIGEEVDINTHLINCGNQMLANDKQMSEDCLQNVSICHPRLDEIRLDEISLDKSSLDKSSEDNKEKYKTSSLNMPQLIESSNSLLGIYSNVNLSSEELTELENQNLVHYIDQLSKYMQKTGKKYDNHFNTIKIWDMKKERDNNDEKSRRNNRRDEVIVKSAVTIE